MDRTPRLVGGHHHVSLAGDAPDVCRTRDPCDFLDQVLLDPRSNRYDGGATMKSASAEYRRA